MKHITRRDFLRLLAAGLGSVALNRFLIGCTPQDTPLPAQPTTARPILSLTPTTLPPTTIPATPTSLSQASPAPSDTPAASATPDSPPDLVVARNGDPEALVRRALAALGGMEAFVSQGARVIVKPNICVAYHTYEYAATTNPWVVGTLVRMCFEAGASSVKVFDLPFGGTPDEAYAISGIQEQVEANGGEMLPMSRFKYQTVKIPNGVSLKKTDVFDEVFNADVLIDVPIAKHHGSARLTLGMKNLMGLVLNRSALHQDLGQRIADLNTLIRPTLTVVDAVRMLMDNGPSGGDLADVKQMDTLIAGADIVAVDSYAATLFGMRPDDIPYIQAGAALGLGTSDLSSVKIEEINAGA
jgi:uncharacterized protein (DUF362 family)